MRMHLVGFFVCLVVIAAPALCASPAQQEDIAQIQAQVQTLDKEVAILKEVSDNRLDAQDQRIGDLDIWTGQQANHMAAISNVTAWVGSLITVIALVGGVMGYFSAARRASDEAKRASEHWFQQHENDLRGQIDALREQANSLQSQLRQKAEVASGKIDRVANEFDDRTKLRLQGIDEAGQKVLAMLDKHQDRQQPVDPSAIAAVQQASIALEAKPEIAFTSDDHYARGLNEYIAGRFDSALLSFDKALRSVQTENISPDNHAKLINARAVALDQLGRSGEAIAIYDEIDRCYGGDASPALRERVAKALVNKGITLGQHGRSEEAIAVFDEVDRRYVEDASPTIREWVAKALVNKGFTLGERDRSEEAIAIFDEIDRRYGEEASPALREQVARALGNKGATLGQLDYREEAITVYDEIDRRYGEDTSPALRKQVARALGNKGLTLGQGDRSGDVIAVYYEIDRRYGREASPAMREEVANALSNSAFFHLLQAKRHWQTETERRNLLALAINDLGRAKQQCANDDLATVLGNLGYALFLSGEVDEAEVNTLECLRLGQVASLEGHRGDARMHRVEPQDSEYEQFLDRLWEELSG